jgi:hypothetical protein
MRFFETLIIGLMRMPEFLSEASHINKEPVFIKGCTTTYCACYSSRTLRDCKVINNSTLSTKEKRSKKENCYNYNYPVILLIL